MRKDYNTDNSQMSSGSIQAFPQSKRTFFMMTGSRILAIYQNPCVLSEAIEWHRESMKFNGWSETQFIRRDSSVSMWFKIEASAITCIINVSSYENRSHSMIIIDPSARVS